MTEPLYPYALTGAETELIEILRMAHMAAFSVSAAHQNGTFNVKLTNVASGKFLEGSGPSFDAAWRDLLGPLPQDALLDLQTRVAARGRRLADRLTLIDGGRA